MLTERARRRKELMDGKKADQQTGDPMSQKETDYMSHQEVEIHVNKPPEREETGVRKWKPCNTGFRGDNKM